MSRQRSEFIHRTTIFEGAFRAWSLIGSLDPEDPKQSNPSISPPNPFELEAFSRTDFVYEPLPRSGLQHPYVKAVLSPWLGAGVNQEAVELGLATLRTWWQHRRKGPNKTAERALAETENIKAVESYLKHFFKLAHCLVFRDKVQPPRSLQAKMKVVSSSFDRPEIAPPISIKGQCIPGAVDLEGIVKKVNQYTSTNKMDDASGFGDQSTVPMVYINHSGDKHVVLEVGGITCAHCVKIVETVLRGCQGSQSPIHGLIDAAADRSGYVLVKIESVTEGKRIANAAIRNLSLVGYAASAREVQTKQFFGKLEDMEDVITVYANAYPTGLFDWEAPCCCPDSGVYRDNCQRHSQINEALFHAFDNYQRQVLSCAREKNPPQQKEDDGGGWNDPMEEDRAFNKAFEHVLNGEFEKAVLDDMEPIPFVPPSQNRSSQQAEFLADAMEEPIEPVPLEGIGSSRFHSHFAPLDLDTYAKMFDTCEDCGPSQL